MNAASTGAALTFDDGLDPVWTPSIPEELCEADASATLFVISPLALRYPRLIEATLQAGHGVEFRCYEHLRHTRTPRAKRSKPTPREFLRVLGLGPRS